MLACAALAVLVTAEAQAAQFKVVTCAGNTGPAPYTVETNTATPQNPGGIFDFANNCGGQGGDPPGQSAFLRITENQGARTTGRRLSRRTGLLGASAGLRLKPAGLLCSPRRP